MRPGFAYFLGHDEFGGFSCGGVVLSTSLGCTKNENNKRL